jgi:hypothetical protein
VLRAGLFGRHQSRQRANGTGSFSVSGLSCVLSLQDARGRWVNRYAYQGKTTMPIERQGALSKWVTLRACAVLRAAAG